MGVDGSSRSNQGRHTRFYDNRRAKTPLIPGDVRTGTSQVSFHRLCTHDSPFFLSLAAKRPSFRDGKARAAPGSQLEEQLVGDVRFGKSGRQESG